MDKVAEILQGKLKQVLEVDTSEGELLERSSLLELYMLKIISHST